MDLRENLVVCIGSPIIDITARVPHEFLQKYNLESNNATLYNENCFNIFHDLEQYSPTYTIGGSITNTAVSAQSWLPLHGVCCYLGAIGRDSYGAKIRDMLGKESVNAVFQEIDEEMSDRCAVLLCDDNRSFVTDLRASKRFDHNFIESHDVENIIEGARFFYMSAFFFRISPAVVKKICVHCAVQNKTFICNIGASFLCSLYREHFIEILSNINVLIGNEEESRQLAEALGYACTDLTQISLFLHGRCCKPGENFRETLVIITRGPKSVLVASNNGVQEFAVPVLQIKQNLNTNGAGDYFVGGFLADYIQNNNIQNCIRNGIRLSLDFIRRNSLTLTHTNINSQKK